MGAEGGEGVREVVREGEEVGAEEVHFLFFWGGRVVGFWWVLWVWRKRWWFGDVVGLERKSRRAEGGILGCKVKIGRNLK